MGNNCIQLSGKFSVQILKSTNQQNLQNGAKLKNAIQNHLLPSCTHGLTPCLESFILTVETTLSSTQSFQEDNVNILICNSLFKNSESLVKKIRIINNGVKHYSVNNSISGLHYRL